MEFKSHWILWAIGGLVAFWIVTKRLPAMGYPSYMPPAGGTRVPGTAPAWSPSLALPVPDLYIPDQPVAVAAGPSLSLRSGRGHF